MRENWIERRVVETQNAVKGTSYEVPATVADEFRALLLDKLQTRLKPEELKAAVTRLAAANNRTIE